MAESVMALYEYEEDFLEVAGKLKAMDVPLSVMTPIPMHDVEKVLGIGKSKVRFFSLTGAILGGVSGFALAAGTALVFLLPTGGRPIIPIPPYLVIMYEMTILFGVLATLLGFHVVSGLPAWKDAPYTPEANIDRFVVSVPADTSDLAAVEGVMREGGAVEIKRVEY
ncbi:MAG: DUF3341 domain-containing protein [Gammaproteobacteria bacterium]|nr:DUF3341 domain-containing protein [Gammaproteobacteria bacterium]NNF60989.1 DUF3341 domain-containing protein [Gammaproteobacteria bacterium]NNM21097.1 DUF3341 domain-containing protein [Gammaproteobacteria bacterium]